MVQLGNPIRVVQEPGLNFKIPLIQDVIYIDKRILALEGQTEEVIASDQKRLLVDSFVRFRIIDPLRFFQAVGSEQVARTSTTSRPRGLASRFTISRISVIIRPRSPERVAWKSWLPST